MGRKRFSAGISYTSIFTDSRQGRNARAAAADKTNGDPRRWREPRYVICCERGSRATLFPPFPSLPCAATSWTQVRGIYPGGQINLPRDYAPVTFIFIEILHSNERPYFFYRTAFGRSPDLSPFLLHRLFRSPTERRRFAAAVFTDKREKTHVDMYAVEPFPVVTLGK